ncbi:MAG TPA: hypothetical protein P5052_04250 [Candidatus Paceibacterota bacterium]|jgi:cell division septal protein FtsQ|nr:hypothetical protein [Candidatus Paceibacterota bacterium]HRZ29919.1 hypothetical protein [Candidatus Paceibacterota bacterium]
MSRRFKTNYLKKQRQRYWKRFLLFFIFICGLGCLAYLVIFSNVFQINDIKISGLKRIPEDVVRKEIESTFNTFKILPVNKNLIFFNDQQIKNIFLADINDIYITKNFFTKTLNVHIVEKQPIAKLIFNDEVDSIFTEANYSNLYLDETGRIFKSDLLNQEKLIKIMINQSVNNAPKNLLDQTKIDNFQKLINRLNQQPNYQNNFYFEYSLNTPSAIMAYINDNFKVYLTLNDQIIDAFETADKFYLEDTQKKNLISSYIDMRYYPEKLYYK